jgi:hypothetical protein
MARIRQRAEISVPSLVYSPGNVQRPDAMSLPLGFPRNVRG